MTAKVTDIVSQNCVITYQFLQCAQFLPEIFWVAPLHLEAWYF